MTNQQKLDLAKLMSAAAIHAGRESGLAEVDHLFEVYDIVALTAVALLASQHVAAKAQGVPSDLDATIAWVGAQLRNYAGSATAQRQISALAAIINPAGSVGRN